MIVRATFVNPYNENKQAALQFELPHYDYEVAWSFARSLSSWILVDLDPSTKDE